MREHGSARCPFCRSRLSFGVKREATGWKVYYQCDPSENCGREWMVGRIPLSSVDHYDDVWDRAEQMWRRI